MDEQWGWRQANSRQRLAGLRGDTVSRKTVVAYVFWWTHYGDAGASYEPAVTPLTWWYGWRMAGRCMIPPEGESCTVISKRYTQRIERHNLNPEAELARLGRKSLSVLKSVELRGKVIGHYLNKNTINKLESLPFLTSFVWWASDRNNVIVSVMCNEVLCPWLIASK